MTRQFFKETMHCDQDFMGQYFNNDYSGYGFQEAVGNQVSSPWTCLNPLTI